jgi:thioredoxin-related protein
MAATVFKDAAVGEFYNQNFINLKIDMEKGDGPNLAKKYGVTAYPTFFFIDEEGKKISTAKGARPVDQFLQLGETALKQNDKSGEYAVKYDAGDRSPELLKKYAYALLAARKEHLKIANEYFATQKDLTTPDNLNTIFDFATESDARVFETMLKYKTNIIQLKSEQLFLDRIEQACSNTVKKAANYKVKDLVTSAKNTMKKQYPAKAAEFAVKADMTYALGTADASLYVKSAKKYLAQFTKNDNDATYKVVLNTVKTFSSNEKAMKQAEKWTKTVVENGGKSHQFLMYAKILYQNKNAEMAFQMAQKAREKAIEEKQSTQMIDEFLKIIKP